MSNDNPEKEMPKELHANIIIQHAILAGLIETATPEQKTAISKSLEGIEVTYAELFDPNSLAMNTLNTMRLAVS